MVSNTSLCAGEEQRQKNGANSVYPVRTKRMDIVMMSPGTRVRQPVKRWPKIPRIESPGKRIGSSFSAYFIELKQGDIRRESL